MNDWKIFEGNGRIKDNEDWQLPDPPSWRPFEEGSRQGESRRKRKGETFQVRQEEVEMVNAALYLRRPLLLTGKPGTGKSSLVYAVARELNLGEVLYWPITTRTTLKEGLYGYDALGRLQEVKEIERQGSQPVSEQARKSQLKNIEKFITLGPLGTALLPSKTKKPRVLLIDEIDKSDIDLPNDLLTLFEEGRFEIPELVRIKEEVRTVWVRTAYTDETEITKSDLTDEISEGRVSCTVFPFMVLTSNGERDFPAPFLRRCLRLTMKPPNKEDLVRIVTVHLEKEAVENPEIDKLIDHFIDKRDAGTLATDQLLNAIFMVTRGRIPTKDALIQQLLQDLGKVDDE